MLLQLCMLKYILEMLSCRKVHMVTKAKFYKVVTDNKVCFIMGAWGGGLKSQKTVQFVTVREGKF